MSKDIGSNKKVKVEFLNGVSNLRDEDNLRRLSQLVPLDALYQAQPDYISMEKVFRLYAKYLGVRNDEVIKDKEELQAEKQNQVQEAMIAQQIQQQGANNDGSNRR